MRDNVSLFAYYVKSLFLTKFVSHKTCCDAGRWHGPNPSQNKQQLNMKLAQAFFLFNWLYAVEFIVKKIILEMFYRLLQATNSPCEYFKKEAGT